MISLLLLIALLYLAIGFVFACVFAFKLVDKFDEQALGAPLGFRLLIIPGSTLLWPYLLKHQLQKEKK